MMKRVNKKDLKVGKIYLISHISVWYMTEVIVTSKVNDYIEYEFINNYDKLIFLGYSDVTFWDEEG